MKPPAVKPPAVKPPAVKPPAVKPPAMKPIAKPNAKPPASPHNSVIPKIPSAPLSTPQSPKILPSAQAQALSNSSEQSSNKLGRASAGLATNPYIAKIPSNGGRSGYPY